VQLVGLPHVYTCHDTRFRECKIFCVLFVFYVSPALLHKGVNSERYWGDSGKGGGCSCTACFFSEESVMLSVQYFFSNVEQREYTFTDIQRNWLCDKII